MAEALEPREPPGRFPELAGVSEPPELFAELFGPEAEPFAWRLPWPGALLDGRADVRFLAVMWTICCFTTVMS